MPQTPILTIDICNSKIVSTIAKNNINNDIEILGVGHCKANGISKGKIINMDLAAVSIKRSLDKARESYGGEFSKVYVSVLAANLETHSVKAMVNVPSGQISVKEIKTVLNTAIHNAAISTDNEILHAIPSSFNIDGSLIEDPQNYIANHLEAKVNILSVNKNYLNNIKQVIRNCGIDWAYYALNSYVGPQALVNEEFDDNKMAGGYLVVDIGSTSTYASIYKGKACVYSKFYAIGGINISKDIAIMLNTSIDDAEDFKIQRASITITPEEAKQKVKLPKTNTEGSFVETSMEYLSTIVHCRVEELLFLIKDDIEQNNMFNSFKSGIILTGGTSKIKGIKELCFKVFERQRLVKLDTSKTFINDYFNYADPMYATTIGLIEYALNSSPYYEIDSSKNLRAKIIKQEPQPIATKPVASTDTTGTDLTNIEIAKEKSKGWLRHIWALLDKHL